MITVGSFTCRIRGKVTTSPILNSRVYGDHLQLRLALLVQAEEAMDKSKSKRFTPKTWKGRRLQKPTEMHYGRVLSTTRKWGQPGFCLKLILSRYLWYWYCGPGISNGPFLRRLQLHCNRVDLRSTFLFCQEGILEEQQEAGRNRCLHSGSCC